MFETVRVYWNKTKKCFSVQTKQDGKWRVWSHNKTVFLYKPKFVIKEGEWQRALREKQRNVHAFIEGGMILPFEQLNNLADIKKTVPVHYDLKLGKFISQNKPIETAYLAICMSEEDRPSVKIAK